MTDTTETTTRKRGPRSTEAEMLAAEIRSIGLRAADLLTYPNIPTDVAAVLAAANSFSVSEDALKALEAWRPVAARTQKPARAVGDKVKLTAEGAALYGGLLGTGELTIAGISEVGGEGEKKKGKRIFLTFQTDRGPFPVPNSYVE